MLLVLWACLALYAPSILAESEANSLWVGTFNIKYDGNPPQTAAASTSGAVSLPASSQPQPSAEPTTSAKALHARSKHQRKGLSHAARVPVHARREAGSETAEQPWSARRAPLAAQVLSEQLDLVGFQEVLHNQLEDLRGLLADQYACLGVGREDGDTQGEATPLCYRKAVLQLQEVQYFWLSDTPDVPNSKTWDNRNVRVATMAKLLDTRSSVPLVAVSTHLDERGPQSRRKGSQLIMDKAQAFAEPGSLVVLMADLNSRQTDEAYIALTGDQYSSTQTNANATSGNANSSASTFLDPRQEVEEMSPISRSEDDPNTLRGRFGEEFSNPGWSDHGSKPKNIDYVLYMDLGAASGEDKRWQTQAYGIMPSYFRGSPQLSDHRMVVAHLQTLT